MDGRSSLGQHSMKLAGRDQTPLLPFRVVLFCQETSSTPTRLRKVGA